MGELDQAGEEPAQGLAAAGRGDEQRVTAGARLIQHRRLVTPQPPAAVGEPSGEGGRQTRMVNG